MKKVVLSLLMRLKKTLLIISALVFSSLVYSQSVDVLFLKNGSIIRGSVVELNPAENVKIQTSDGSLFVFSMQEVDHLSKDEKIKDKPNTIVANINVDTNLLDSKARNATGKIYRKGDSFYWKWNEEILSNNDYEKFFDDDLFDTYKGAKTQFNTGTACWVIGIACLGLSVINLTHMSSDTKAKDNAIAFATGADVFICLGSVFRGIGNGRLKWVEREFNSRCGNFSSSNSIINMKSLRFEPSLMMTAQKDLGFGASVVFAF